MNEFRPKTDVEMYGYKCICNHYKFEHTELNILISFGLWWPCWYCTCKRYKADKSLNENNEVAEVKGKSN